MLAVWKQSLAKLTVYSNRSLKWLQANAPVYYDIVDKTVGPYVRLFWEKLFDGLLFVWDASVPVRAWANKTFPPILENVSKDTGKIIACN